MGQTDGLHKGLRILSLTRKGEGFVGAPSKRHAFEMTVSKVSSYKFAGPGWPPYRQGDTIAGVVRRIYGSNSPDWVFDKDDNFKTPPRRDYKIGFVCTDLHGKWSYKIGTPTGLIDLINKARYDAVFLRYKYIFGTKWPHDIFLKKLGGDIFWLPWSIGTDTYFPREKKTWDVTFLGFSSPKFYPLRAAIWSDLPELCSSHGFRLLMRRSPTGGTYDRHISKLREAHFVGRTYAEALGRSRIFIFGCSKFRYPLQKFTEGMASGCLVMSNRPGGNEGLGFIDGQTYVEIDRKNWKSKLIYYMKHPREAEKIAARGRRLVLQRHTHEKRAGELLKMLGESL